MKESDRKRRRLMVCLGIGTAVFTADQLLKASIERQADETFPRDMPGTNGAVRYEKCHNDGLMLGALREEGDLVKLLPAVSTAAFCGRLYEMTEERGKHLELLGLTLAISGALSNLYDRFLRGYVVDYISIKKGFLKKLVINLGDIAIFAGACLMALKLIIRSLREFFRILG